MKIKIFDNMSEIKTFKTVILRNHSDCLLDVVFVIQCSPIPYNVRLFCHLVVGWLVVFNVPSTARSFRDGTPIYCPLRRTWSSINTPFRPGIEPRAVAWQSITLPLRYASSTLPSGVCNCRILVSFTNKSYPTPSLLSYLW